jgi:hypothetical protein
VYAQEWVFEPLLRTASDGSAISGLASRFHFSSPARVALELREGAKFSDGSAVTTEDVRRSLEDAGLEVREQTRGLLVESLSGTPVEPILRHNPIFKRVGDKYLGSGPFEVVSLDPSVCCSAGSSRRPGRSPRSCFSDSPPREIRSRVRWPETRIS